jgi:hypothetical protein
VAPPTGDNVISPNPLVVDVFLSIAIFAFCAYLMSVAQIALREKKTVTAFVIGISAALICCILLVLIFMQALEPVTIKR